MTTPSYMGFLMDFLYIFSNSQWYNFSLAGSTYENAGSTRRVRGVLTYSPLLHVGDQESFLRFSQSPLSNLGVLPVVVQSWTILPELAISPNYEGGANFRSAGVK